MSAPAAIVDAASADVVICVFAHNEAERIVAALSSLPDACGRLRWRAMVLANGCTDATVDTARSVAARLPQVQVEELSRGDKCNAWNHFVHNVAGAARHYAFMDGDVVARPHAVAALHAALEHTSANGATALPASGRSREQFRRMLLTEGGVAGNLYALRGAFIDRIRASHIRLPTGIVGDDSLVGALAMWDLDPVHEPWEPRRIVACEAAEFCFDSMSPLSHRDLHTQWRRMVRYSRRHFENRMFGRLLRAEGLAALPETHIDLYRAALGDCRLEWRGLTTIFDVLALRQMRRAAEAPR